MEKLSYEKIEDMLEDRNAKDKGRYFICDCPSCEKPEAFIYKNNPRFITCNRAENCGSQYIIKYEKIKNQEELNLEDLKESYPELTKEQIESINWLKKAFVHFNKYEESELLNNKYRGLSPETTKNYIIDLKNEGYVNAMFHKTQSLFKKDYRNNSYMMERNLIMPIYNDNGDLERMLMRSTINPNTKLKELSLIIDPSKETRDFFIDIPKEAKTVVITESLFDSLSFKEIDNDIGFIGLTGSLKTRQVENYLKENKRDLSDKNILLALDNDKAGNNALQNLVRTIETNNIGDNWSIFDYEDNWSVYKPKEKKAISDPNDFLQEAHDSFVKQYHESIEKPFKKNLNKNISL